MRSGNVASALCAALLAAGASAQTMPLTNTTLATRACQPPFDTLPFCDTTLALNSRVDDLIARLWAESGGNVSTNIIWHLTARNMGKSANPALGIPEYDFGCNSVHGVQSSCLSVDSVTRCPTSFPVRRSS